MNISSGGDTMNVKLTFEQNTLTAYLSGEIDHHSARGIRQAVDADIEKYRPDTLVLDFGRVNFMDSSGIGLIMGRYRMMKIAGGIVRIGNVPRHLERLIALSGIKQITEQG